MKMTDSDYKVARKNMNFAKKSPERIQQEMALLKSYWHCVPLHYIRYQLFNKNLSEEELKDYIPPYFHYNIYNNKILKDVNSALYANKYTLYKEFEKRGIPTPQVEAYILNKKLYDINKLELSMTWFLDNLREGEKLFIKPVLGQGGTGIIVLKKQNNEIIYNNQSISCSKIFNLFGANEYIIQKGIIQDPKISEINPSSVNTLRVVTQKKDSGATICVAVMRIGRHGMDVDNSHQGGISVNINLDTGRLNDCAYSEHGGETFTHHPDSGSVFKQLIIPNWSHIKDLIVECANKFPELPEIAWDVAITTDGIQMIELNLGYGIDHLQCCCGGMRRILNIYPDFTKL